MMPGIGLAVSESAIQRAFRVVGKANAAAE
jgi:hypothetical protein